MNAYYTLAEYILMSSLSKSFLCTCIRSINSYVVCSACVYNGFAGMFVIGLRQNHLDLTSFATNAFRRIAHFLFTIYGAKTLHPKLSC